MNTWQFDDSSLLRYKTQRYAVYHGVSETAKWSKYSGNAEIVIEVLTALLVPTIHGVSPNSSISLKATNIAEVNLPTQTISLVKKCRPRVKLTHFINSWNSLVNNVFKNISIFDNNVRNNNISNLCWSLLSTDCQRSTIAKAAEGFYRSFCSFDLFLSNKMIDIFT